MTRRQKIIFILGWALVAAVWLLGNYFRDCEVIRQGNGWTIYKGKGCEEHLPTYNGPYTPRKKTGYKWDNWV